MGTARSSKGARWSPLSIAAVLAGLAAAVLGCGEERLESAPLDREIVIDGVPDEWDGAWTHLEGSPVSLALLNDEKYLYLCMTTDYRALVRRVLLARLAVGLGPDGDAKDALVISRGTSSGRTRSGSHWRGGFGGGGGRGGGRPPVPEGLSLEFRVSLAGPQAD
ncbi:MAG: hypothetical protein ABIH26_01160 [Candidatus Eisenbacteria bacterium]